MPDWFNPTEIISRLWDMSIAKILLIIEWVILLILILGTLIIATIAIIRKENKNFSIPIVKKITQWHYFGLSALILLVIAVLLGGGLVFWSAVQPSATTQSALNTAPKYTIPPTSPPLSTYSFSGTGNQVSSPIEIKNNLKDGIVKFHETCDSNSFFYLVLGDVKNLNNKYEIVNYNSSVPFDGSQIRVVKEGTYEGIYQEYIPPGTYVLGVQTVGNWTITIDEY